MENQDPKLSKVEVQLEISSADLETAAKALQQLADQMRRALIIAKGERGERGPRGPPGPKGDKGDPA